MSDAILVAIISGVATFAGVLITVWAGLRKQSQESAIQQAVTETKIEELTREVRMHNDFASRIPQLEIRIEALEKRLSHE